MRPGSLLAPGYPREYLTHLGFWQISSFPWSFPIPLTAIPALTPLILPAPFMPALPTSWQPPSLWLGGGGWKGRSNGASSCSRFLRVSWPVPVPRGHSSCRGGTNEVTYSSELLGQGQSKRAESSSCLGSCLWPSRSTLMLRALLPAVCLLCSYPFGPAGWRCFSCQRQSS